jgi:hypothetical protein
MKRVAQMTSNPTDLTESELETLQQFMLAEQGFFWTRFVAFSAIITGQVVLLTTKEFALIAGVAGLVTSLFWIFIQAKSLRYVEHKKKLFWAQSANQRLRMNSDGMVSSTTAAVYFSFLTGAFWCYIVFSKG